MPRRAVWSSGVNGEGAVVFDLFGTLVGQFSRVRNDEALRRAAELAGLDPDRCQAEWGPAYDARVRGSIRGIRGHLSAVAALTGVPLAADPLDAAVADYAAFVDGDLLTPLPGAVDLLQGLRDAGIRIGLLSNCHHDVADHIRRSQLGSLIDAWSLSCLTGHRKPEPAAYAHALAQLGNDPEPVLFVGDGSDDELAGAAAAGLVAVLARSDLSDSYDPHRSAVTAWQGPAIEDLDADLPMLIDLLSKSRRRR